MATKKKMLQAAAGNAGGDPLDITDVFSTHLYTGTGSAQTITNNIDLTEGGLVWVKHRGQAGFDHMLADTETGVQMYQSSNSSTQSLGPNTTALTSFNSNGFSIGSLNDYNYGVAPKEFVSWSFRKAPKFFDCVQFSGTGSQQSISHALDSDVGFLIVKCTSAGGTSWACWHRTFSSNQFIQLNANNPVGSNSVFFPVAPTSSQFTVGTDGDVNQSGATYVAYLFAHNNNDGTFGPDSDQDIIKCGSFTTDSSGLATVNLGFEPQFLIRRQLSGGNTWNRNWDIYDSMRGITMNNDYALEANTSDAEASMGNQQNLTPTGFTVHESSANQTFIYISIRRGQLAPPEAGTEVFAIDTMGSTGDGKEPGFRSGFPVDMQIYTRRAGLNKINSTRLNQGEYLLTDLSTAEASTSSEQFDYNNGFYAGTSTSSTYISWMWKRAPGFFDVVSTTSASSTVGHNLGVAPELAFFKRRDGDAGLGDWYASAGLNGHGFLNKTNAWGGGSSLNIANLANATTVNTGSAFIGNGYDMIIYLFASLDGISKVGSLIKTSSSLNVDCGFTSGARFVLIKRTDSTGDWWVFDTLRGINSSAVDPYLFLNSNAAEGTNFNLLTPLSSGFTINSAFSAGSYIFYAIA